MSKKILIGVLILMFILSACEGNWNEQNYDYQNNENNYNDSSPPSDEPNEPDEGEPESQPPAPPAPATEGIHTKWDLWASGETMLRGANIWQALVIEDLDGLEFKGSGHVGPPFVQADFDALAALGANYVSISGPGLFTETPPFQLDPGVQENLDNLIEMAAAADLFVTIGFRTGPGRSEFYLCCEGEEEFEDYYNETVWQDLEAQAAWAEMWRYTAERYGANPAVIGYKLIVEPNPNDMYLDIWEPGEFYPAYAGTTYDWNQMYPPIVDAIRAVDPETPILVGGMAYSAVEWLPSLEVLDQPNIVYTIHQYAPYPYTHQWGDLDNTYPGYFDTNYDDREEDFNRAWLEDLFSIADAFISQTGVTVGVDEFGVVRWVPNAPAFMFDQMAMFEQRGWNHALWSWDCTWEAYAEEENAFNFRYGTDPDSYEDTPNPLQDVILEYWSRNTAHPSNVPWAQP